MLPACLQWHGRQRWRALTDFDDAGVEVAPQHGAVQGGQGVTHDAAAGHAADAGGLGLHQAVLDAHADLVVACGEEEGQGGAGQAAA